MDAGAAARVHFVDPIGPPISTSEQTSDLIGNAWMEHVKVVAVPVARLDPEFFRLRSGFAGEFAQKMVNYQLTLAIVGDVGEWVDASEAFGDFVLESNRGRHVWFVADRTELEQRLEARVARLRRVRRA